MKLMLKSTIYEKKGDATMIQSVINEDELKLLLSAESNLDNENMNSSAAQEPQKIPKLTMKILYELIKELQQQNTELSQRIHEVERQLDEFLKMQESVAAAVELPEAVENKAAAENLISPALSSPPAILISRSVRHPAPKKRSFWSLWAFLFRPSPLRHHHR
jgi:small-conductance mechanosensitive channel